MKFGIYGLHRFSMHPDEVSTWAGAAEHAGFESIWVGDHLSLPADMPGVEGPRLEALVALTHLAAATTSIKLGAGVIVVPQREPHLLAKQLSSVDHLSQGRLIVGVGVGHLEAELTALGVSMSERGTMADRCIDQVLALWTGVDADLPVAQGRPFQQPHPPLVVGGHSDAALRRATRLGAGWFGWMLSPDETAETIARIGQLTDGAEVTVAPPGKVDRSVVETYAELGVDRLIVGPDGDGDPASWINTFASTVL